MLFRSGTLDRVDRLMQFTHFTVRASLTVPPGTSVERADKLLRKAEETCLITRSLKGEVTLDAHVAVSSA